MYSGDQLQVGTFNINIHYEYSIKYQVIGWCVHSHLPEVVSHASRGFPNSPLQKRSHNISFLMPCLQADDKFNHLKDDSYGIDLPTSATKAENLCKIKRDQSPLIPEFQLDELIRGEFLGSGSFSNVYEIVNFRLRDDAENDKKISPESKMKSSRKFLAQRCLQGGKSGDVRYAIKCLRHDIVSNPRMFEHGIMDLVTESQFLSSIEHPNIIKIRGVAQAIGELGYTCIIMDRLYDTLECRMKSWREMFDINDDQSSSSLSSSSSSSSLSSFRRRMRRKKNTRNNNCHHQQRNLNDDKCFLSGRLRIALDIAGALQYLHSQRITYRDLKPDNLGFDMNNGIKIFDFGLAKELPPLQDTFVTTYELSGGCGTLRYMAPEVAQGQPYNFSVDVYSFAIVLWELLTLQKAFEKLEKSKHKRKRNESKREIHYTQVVLGGQRPTLAGIPSKFIQNLLTLAWSADMRERPDMNEICRVLKDEIRPI